MSMQTLCIEPQSTVEITLLPMSGHNLPTGINGYMYAHRKLEFSVTVGFPECNGFARVDVDLKVGGVSEPCRDTACARLLPT